MRDRLLTLLDRALAGAAVGALTAGLLRAAWPNPPWWFVGLLAGALAVFLPPPPRK